MPARQSLAEFYKFKINNPKFKITFSCGVQRELQAQAEKVYMPVSA